MDDPNPLRAPSAWISAGLLDAAIETRTTSREPRYGAPWDAASVLCNLPGHRLIEVVDIPDGRRQVLVEAVEVEDGCPDCDVLSRRLHQRTRQRMRDFPGGGWRGELEVVVVRRRLVCAEP